MLALAAAAPEWLRGMVLVAAYTGLRLFEIAALRPADVLAPTDGHGWRVVVRLGKGGYVDEQSVVFPAALEALQFAAAACPDWGRLFTTSAGRPVSRQYVARHFAPLAVSTGYEGGGFHALRHFHAVWLLDRGLSVQDVAAQLRHHDRGELVQRRYGRHMAARAALRRIEQVQI